MSPQITKADLNQAVHVIKQDMAQKGDIRDLIGHFNQSQGAQNIRLDHIDKRFDQVDERFNQTDERLDHMDERLGTMDAKLDALLEAVATRRELHNLVRELKARGVTLDESKIFAM